MENVILCNGSYAQIPYLLEEEDLPIYSIEELCYFLYKNAFLIREDFFSDPLLDWIRNELHLEDWSTQLKSFKDKGEPILRSIEFLFGMTGFYGEEQIRQVRSILQDSGKLTVMERKKLRADSYYKRRCFLKAAAGYEQLLREVPSDQVRFRAKLYHDLGVCFAAMFFFKKAAEYFKEAFHIYPNTETYVQYLAALKLGNSQEAYLEHLAEHPESYDDSLEVESRMMHIEQQWDKMSFDEMIKNRMEEEDTSYYQVIAQLLDQAKTEYMNMVDKR